MLFSFCHITLSSSIAVMPLGTAGIWKFNCSNYSLRQKHTLGSIPPSTYHAVPTQLNLLEENTQSHSLTLDSWSLSTSGLQAARQTQSIHSPAFLMTTSYLPSLLKPPSSSLQSPLPIPVGKQKHSAGDPHKFPLPPPVDLLAPMFMDATLVFVSVDGLSSSHPWLALPLGKNFYPFSLSPSKSSFFLLYQQIFPLSWTFLNINMLWFLLSKTKNCVSCSLSLS